MDADVINQSFVASWSADRFAKPGGRGPYHAVRAGTSLKRPSGPNGIPTERAVSWSTSN